MEEEITWKLDKYPDMLVVESIITNEVKQQAVRLTITSDYFDAESPKPAQNAIVRIIEGGNTYTFSENDTIPGLYYSDIQFAGTPLKAYELKITLPDALNGLKDFSAISVMPKGIDMDSIICELYDLPDIEMGGEESGKEKDSILLAIFQFGFEPESPGNFYFNKVYINNKIIQKTSKEYPIYSDEYRNGSYSDLNIYLKNTKGGDTIRYRLFSIEKSFYKFLEGIKNADQGGDAFSINGPPANAVGNISDGKALGFFAASYVSEKTTIAIDKR
jgi:hypothetical protein